MKDLYESILGGTRNVIKKTDEDFKAEITNWIIANYRLSENDIKISDKPNKNGVYEVDINTNVEIRNRDITYLTNGLFEFGIITGGFDCSWCYKLVSLKGAPHTVTKWFDCSYCDELTGLANSPKKVGKEFTCTDCPNLTSLEGAPEKVCMCFGCYNCPKLTSLKGSPKEVDGNFVCNGCKSLTSLKGAPRKVSGNFCCERCINLIDYSELDKIKIKGDIYK